MKRLVALGLAVVFAFGITGLDAEAASKKKPKPKYTEEQLKQIRRQAMDVCRKRFGQGVVIRAVFDTRTNRYICYTN